VSTVRKRHAHSKGVNPFQLDKRTWEKGRVPRTIRQARRLPSGAMFALCEPGNAQDCILEPHHFNVGPTINRAR